MNRIMVAIGFLLISCANFPSSNKEVIGTYKSLRNEEDHAEFIEMYPNQQYAHYLIEVRDTINRTYGNWKLLDKKGVVHLSSWTTFSPNGGIKFKTKDILIKISNGKLLFSGDDENKNFQKCVD